MLDIFDPTGILGKILIKEVPTLKGDATMAEATLQAERVEAIRNLGAEVIHEDVWVGEVGTPERRPEPLTNTVRCVQLPFSSDEWCSIAMREGSNYVGGCCGNMSALQDVIENVFRFGSGLITDAELLSIAEMARDHGDDFFKYFKLTDDEAFAMAIADWQAGKLGPWEKLGTIFSALEPALHIDHLLIPIVNPVRERDEERRVLIELSNTLNVITWQDLFTREDPDDIDQHSANRLVDLAKLLSLTRQLLEILEDQDASFEGVALVNAENGSLLSNMRGPCLLSTREAAERMIELTLRSSPEMEDQIKIVTATVTLQDGLTLGEE